MRTLTYYSFPSYDYWNVTGNCICIMALNRWPWDRERLSLFYRDWSIERRSCLSGLQGICMAGTAPAPAEEAVRLFKAFCFALWKFECVYNLISLSYCSLKLLFSWAGEIVGEVPATQTRRLEFDPYKWHENPGVWGGMWPKCWGRDR